MNSLSLPRRLTAAATLFAALGLATATPLAPAQAASAQATSAQAPAQAASAKLPRGDAYMGIGVRAHGGGGAGGGVQPMVTQTEGVDVSSYQGTVDWATLWNSGVRWAYTKATEGTYYTNPDFAQQYNGPYNVGMIRAAYHFATPDTTSGGVQADYFVNHGGGWSADGRTLPGVLDIEWDPYGAACYGLSQSAMVSWISGFLNEYHARTGRWAVIYTATSWWVQCTGNYGGFAADDPLWIANYNGSPGTLPAGWGYYTMWQYTDSGPYVGDHDEFNGDITRVQALALG
ncbi:lysozyme [Streptacidiphilus anmyonensis]|uniref:lysozyme n=1 Tax=Streptacidiphilus anmyonensis TaxID=405782 RepID=UPI0005A8ACB8|nr:lysozyme [Streptacidiphilus anmyonensis]